MWILANLLEQLSILAPLLLFSLEIKFEKNFQKIFNINYYQSILKLNNRGEILRKTPCVCILLLIFAPTISLITNISQFNQ